MGSVFCCNELIRKNVKDPLEMDENESQIYSDTFG